MNGAVSTHQGELRVRLGRMAERAETAPRGVGKLPRASSACGAAAEHFFLFLDDNFFTKYFSQTFLFWMKFFLQTLFKIFSFKFFLIKFFHLFKICLEKNYPKIFGIRQKKSINEKSFQNIGRGKRDVLPPSQNKYNYVAPFQNKYDFRVQNLS